MITNQKPRTDYNKIAKVYDNHPYRAKSLDENWVAFVKDQRGKGLSTDDCFNCLDMGCGTGNQLVTNYQHYPQVRWVGLDLFGGMLQQAQKKKGNIRWVQGNAAYPPFPKAYFDYISNQFSFHHVYHKNQMLAAIYRLLQPGGRFVMTNMAPHEDENWAVYRYFAGTFEVDLRDFWPKERLIDLMRRIGFVNITFTLERNTNEQPFKDFVALVRDRASCSQLITISEASYQAGLQKLEADLEALGDQAPPIRTLSQLLVIQADKATDEEN